MAYRAANRRVRQFHSIARASKKQTAAAHVAAADKLDRKNETVAEDIDHRIRVFPRRDAAQQNDLARRAEIGVEAFGAFA